MYRVEVKGLHQANGAESGTQAISAGQRERPIALVNSSATTMSFSNGTKVS